MKIKNNKALWQFLSGEKNKKGKAIFDKWYYGFNDQITPFNILNEKEKERIKSEIHEGINNTISIMDDQSIIKYLDHEKRKYIRRGLMLAASILLIFTTGFYFMFGRFSNNPGADNTFSEIRVPKGEKSQVILPDGSTVWLNSDTKFRYFNNFNKKREVFLEGEAYFDVKKKTDKIFIVKTSHIDIKVYGTTFNVKSNATDKFIETTLVRGKISIEDKEEQDKEIILKPKQKFTFYKDTPKNNIIQQDDIPKPINNEEQKKLKTPLVMQTEKMQINSEIDTEPHTAWIENKLVFRDESFADIAIKMERWYDIKIHFNDESIKKYKYRGTFENETINQALDALKLTTPFDYNISHRDVYISLRDKP